MNRHNHCLKKEKLLTLVLFVIALAVLAGFVPVRLSALNGIAENALLEAGADSVSVGGVSVKLFGGLRVEEVKTYKRISGREEYRANISSIDVSCNLFLAAVWVLTKPSLFNPQPQRRDLFLEVYQTPFEIIGDGCVQMISAWPCKKLVINNADIRFFERKKVGISARGVSVKLGRKSKKLHGRIGAREIKIPSTAHVEDFSIRISADGAHMNLLDGKGALFGGKLSVKAAIDLNSASLIDGKVNIDKFDLEKFCVQTSFSPGRMSGLFSMEAILEHSGVGSLAGTFDSLKARGSALVTDLRVENLPLQTTFIANFVSPELKSLQFSEVKGDFTVSKGKFRFKELIGRGDIMSFKSSGWVGFDAQLDYEFEGVFSKEFASTLSGFARSSLEVTDDGGRRFKCRIGGRFKKPRVEVDRSVYSRALRNLFR